MFINERVNHKKFGEGVITDINTKDGNLAEATLYITFDKVGDKKLSITAFGSKNGFMTSDNPETIPFVDNLIEEAEAKKAVIFEKKMKRISYIPPHSYDETGQREVTVENWAKAMEVAGEYRFPNESRAVVMDRECIFINASAGCRHIEIDIKSCNKIYEVCDNKAKSFMGHKWKYATKEQIQNIIDKMIEEKEGNNDTE